MSILDEIDIAKSHKDVQSIVLEQAKDVQELDPEHMILIRIKAKVPILPETLTVRKTKAHSVIKGEEMCRYYEDVLSSQNKFRCLQTKFMINVNCISSAIFTNTIKIGWDVRVTNFEILKLLMIIAKATLHFKPIQDDIFLTLKNSDGYGESNRISFMKFFDYDVCEFIFKKFDYIVPRSYLRNTQRRRLMKSYAVIENYYSKHKIKTSGEHYVPDVLYEIM